MKLIQLFIFSAIICACKNTSTVNTITKDDFTIAFGSCNKQYKENILWKEVLKNNPRLWIWGGDVVYADTDNMEKLAKQYQIQWQQKGYQTLANSIPILGTWDDHDYGLNDGGEEFYKKDQSKEQFLNFLKVPNTDARRNRKGVYHSQLFKSPQGSVKVIVLDTRYFRTALTKSSIKGKRYEPNPYGAGTVLGNEQWKWLEHELNNSSSDFNLIVSSIQVLSNKHGFETWGNFPHEVDKLFNTIQNSKAKGVIILSGDRHISEFSKTKTAKISYPIIDFTSSGLTHSYSGFNQETNPFRFGKVITEISFGILKFDFKNHIVTMEMRGKNNKLLQAHTQKYN